MPPPADLTPITLTAMRQRHQELAPFVVRTPVAQLFSPRLDGLFGGGQIVLKLECFQHTGTFKARGALSVARRIPKADLARGITAASAGNHAIAAAWAARLVGAPARVVMMSTANPFRVARARAEGAEIIILEGGGEAIAEAERLQREEGLTFIHPFEGVHTTLGAAGVGLEMVDDIDGLDAVVVAVGGGGLISGVASAVKTLRPSCKVYGVEPIGAASMSRSLAAGRPMTLDRTDTIADSLAPPMALPLGTALAAAHVDDMVTLSDDEICAGMVLLMEEGKIAVEPAAGAAMAAACGPLRARLMGKRVGVLVCGANIDHASYGMLLARGAPAVAELLG